MREAQPGQCPIHVRQLPHDDQRPRLGRKHTNARRRNIVRQLQHRLVALRPHPQHHDIRGAVRVGIGHANTDVGCEVALHSLQGRVRWQREGRRVVHSRHVDKRRRHDRCALSV